MKGQKTNAHIEITTPTTNCKHEIDQAKAFLSALDHTTMVFDFRTFDDNQDRKSPSLVRKLRGTLDQHWDQLCQLSDQGAGIFVTVNETDGQGVDASNVTKVRAFFVDTDGAPTDGPLAFEPHFCVESSKGNWHYYWPVQNVPLDQFSLIQKQMIKAWGTDKSVNDLGRVMRLPGFPHQKINAKKGLTGAPFIVRFEDFTSFFGPEDFEPFQSRVVSLDKATSAPSQAPSQGSQDQPYKAISFSDVMHTPTLAEATLVLSGISPDLEYSDWLIVLQGLHWSGDDFLPLAIDWSSKGKTFVEGEIETKWRGFDRNRDNAVTWASVLWLVKGQNTGGYAQADILADSEKLAVKIIGRLRQITKGLLADDQFPDVKVKTNVIGKMIGTSFLSPSSNKILFMNNQGDLVEFAESKAWRYLTQTFGNPVNLQPVIDALPDLTPKELVDITKAINAAPSAAIMDHISLYRQRGSLAWRVDMFAKEAVFVLREFDAQIVIPHRAYPVAPFDMAHVNDFVEHWPECEEVLQFMAAARFAVDRKAAFLWWRATSDFGKNLFMSLLKELGIIAETSVKEVESMMEGKPVGLSAHSFKRAIVLWVDEFKGVKSELKQLQNEITLSPKFELRQTVEIFTKFFTFAEENNSLVTSHGVEDQFANRMNFIMSTGNITERPLFVGEKPKYAQSLKNWFSQVLNQNISLYQQMGQERADVNGRVKVSQRALQNVATLGLARLPRE